MTIKLFDKIKTVINNICSRSNTSLDDTTKQLLYYNCYLVSYEIRNGFYPEVFNRVDASILKEIKKIDNLDYTICACYDYSKGKDTLYIYNKNRYDSIKPSLDYLNTHDHENILRIDKHIATLLSYDKMQRDYREAFDETKTLSITFEIIDFRDRLNKKKIQIMTYQSYKNKLVSNYERLQRINNLPIFNRYRSLRCYMIVDDVGM